MFISKQHPESSKISTGLLILCSILLPMTNRVAIQLEPDAVKLFGGKKKYKTINKLSKSRGKMYSRRRRKNKKAKTKIRKFHKNILKGGAENEVYKNTLEKYVPILPKLQKVLGYAKWMPSYITSLITIVRRKADRVGHSKMKNADQLDLILQPALQDFIDSISTNYLISSLIRKYDITAVTFIKKKIPINAENKAKLESAIPNAIIEPHPTKTGIDITARKNILLIIPDEYKLIPNFITDLEVLQAGINYSGDAIQDYVFPEKNLPPPEENLPPPTTDDDASKQQILIPARNVSKPHPEYAIQLEPDAVELFGGKKKYKTRNKLSKSRGKMYSRRRRKNNRRY